MSFSSSARSFSTLARLKSSSSLSLLPFFDPISKFEITGTDIFLILFIVVRCFGLSCQDAYTVFSTLIRIIDSFDKGQPEKRDDRQCL